eukprot:CAMPEP_0194360378 /NCGR_PEP_ID=MMETSP0174-20130528/7692_1 /TAXON_ID=216777 /ORGANISM="Proboscia alata, Strain PI-D3" /LENGTH=477 /DNA_ID=CAMNT_0039131817 /DNA_START=40 /DNA_END=1473 /DNA_ORIENTATION=-
MEALKSPDIEEMVVEEDERISPDTNTFAPNDGAIPRDPKDRTVEGEEYEDTPWSQRITEVFKTYWMLGFIAFGGPQAHVAILRDHLVVQRNWMDEEAFTELFAIGQGLPGPTSTQLVVSTALLHAGPLGGILAFFLWNLPGLIILTICGVVISVHIDPYDAPWFLIGLPPAAISLVFKAFYGFGLKLDQLGKGLAMVSCLVAIWINGDEVVEPTSSQFVYPTMLVCGGILTYFDSRRTEPFSEYKSPGKGWNADDDRTLRRIGIPVWVGILIWTTWLVVLLGTILVKNAVEDNHNDYLNIFETMYRIGSIIFGGGQVVLPMLQTEVVPQWMTKDEFFQGLALSQSMPGPLFNFSAYLGAVYKGVPGALVAYVGLFGPGVILIFGMVPFWARLRKVDWFRAALKGVNATAIGLVGAACVILWEAAVTTTADAIVFVFAGTLACFYGVQAPLVVIGGGILGAILCEDAASLGQIAYCDK